MPPCNPKPRFYLAQSFCISLYLEPAQTIYQASLVDKPLHLGFCLNCIVNLPHHMTDLTSYWIGIEADVFYKKELLGFI